MAWMLQPIKICAASQSKDYSAKTKDCRTGTPEKDSGQKFRVLAGQALPHLIALDVLHLEPDSEPA
jgi:hypothetical protein